MPIAYVDIPAGISAITKEKLHHDLFEAIHEAWPIPDTRVFLQEWPARSASQDGVLSDEPVRPICSLDAPPELSRDAKRKLVKRISEAIGEACGRTNEQVVLPSGTVQETNWVLTFFREYPLDRAALGEYLQDENPMTLEALAIGTGN
ncbi:phenylpyruvate tautomerase PptA (4-oxalocrotonate tautomerase family) [Nocardia sp. GAS34]|uniref:hypothetical protein n=1 Tax=unclassified Nocardia TaxID=2637762 RepID=UPI003D1AE663